MLLKLLNAYTRSNWKFYFNFAVYDFNTVEHFDSFLLIYYFQRNALSFY